MERVYDRLSIFFLGGILYGIIEILWRGRTHWSMIVTGGLVLLFFYIFRERYPEVTLFKRCLFAGVIITFLEFAVGCIVNLSFQWNVWDYSSIPLNFKGQVCLLYSLIWSVMGIPMTLTTGLFNRILN